VAREGIVLLPWFVIASALLLACSGSATAPSIAEPSTTAAPRPKPTANENSGDAAAVSIPIASSGPIELPADFKSCSSNEDCVIVAVGCCSEVAANRAHSAAVRRAIQSSERRECPVKAACGRGPDGTDDGQPAECAKGRCALPIVDPDTTR
jgi:hypothetical protein